MSLKEWIEIYEKKLNQIVEVNDGFIWIYESDKGFMKYLINKSLETIMVKETCGDGRYWHNRAYQMAVDNGLKRIATFLCRNPKAFFRLYGGKYECQKGDEFWGSDGHGGIAVAYPYSDRAYFTIQYLDKNEVITND